MVIPPQFDCVYIFFHFLGVQRHHLQKNKKRNTFFSLIYRVCKVFFKYMSAKNDYTSIQRIQIMNLSLECQPKLLMIEYR